MSSTGGAPCSKAGKVSNKPAQKKYNEHRKDLMHKCRRVLRSGGAVAATAWLNMRRDGTNSTRRTRKLREPGPAHVIRLRKMIAAYKNGVSR